MNPFCENDDSYLVDCNPFCIVFDGIYYLFKYKTWYSFWKKLRQWLLPQLDDKSIHVIQLLDIYSDL